MMEAIIERIVMPWKAMIVFVLLTALVGLAQLVVYSFTIYEPKVKAGDITCTVKNYTREGVKVVANLRCGEHDAHISDAEFLAAYLSKPQPFVCTLYEGGERADCKTLKK